MALLKKYVNWKLTHADKTAEAEGYPLVLENCKANKRMKHLEIYGNSFQDGTPTPDNPIEVESVGVKSVNLININDIQTFDANGQNLIRYGWKFDDLNGNYTFTYDGTIVAYYKLISNGIYGNANNLLNNTKINVATGDILLIYAIGESNWRKISNVQMTEGSTPLPYEPYGKYKIPVVQRGVNLFSMAKAGFTEKTVNGITFTPLDDERIHIKGKLEDATKNALYNPVLKNRYNLKAGIYNLKGHGYTSGLQLLFGMYKKGNFVVNLNHNSYNQNLSETLLIQHIYLAVDAGNTREWDDIISIQITKGSGTKNLPYEPYIEPVTTNIFLDEPLRKIGDYADYVDFKENKVVRNTREKVFDGSEDWIFGTTKEITQVFYYVINSYNPVHCISNRFVSGLDGDVEKLVSLGDKIYLAIKKTTASDVDTFKTWLSENNVDVIYSLAEPTEEPITCELPKLTAKTTIIEVDTSLAPSNMYGKYIKR